MVSCLRSLVTLVAIVVSIGCLSEDLSHALRAHLGTDIELGTAARDPRHEQGHGRQGHSRTVVSQRVAGDSSEPIPAAQGTPPCFKQPGSAGQPASDSDSGESIYCPAYSRSDVD